MQTLTTSGSPRPLLRRDGERIVFSAGYLNLPRMFATSGLLAPEALAQSPDGHEPTNAIDFERAERLGVDAVEDFIGWGAVEIEPGRWDWDPYVRDSQEAAKRGMGYIACAFVHVMPPWARHDPRYPRAMCVEHGESGGTLSIFSAETVELYDRFYEQMRANLGGAVDLIRFATPADAGEIAYPAGFVNFAFQLQHVHEGFWVGEPQARAHFRSAMQQAYSDDLGSLNRAWGTSHRSFSDVEYAPDGANEVWRHDFVSWYHDALTERVGVLFGVLRKHFPSTPLLFNFGWAFEKPALGFDIQGLVRVAAEHGVEVRSPIGSMISFLYSKRVATAVRHHRPAGFSTEPMDGEASAEAIALALFKDLSTGVTWHYDFARNYERAPASYAAARELWRSGEYPVVRCALFHPSTQHHLLRRESEPVGSDYFNTGYPGYPNGLISFAEALRSIVDFDVVDEPLIADEALQRYRVLLWPLGAVALHATIDAVLAWVRQGGVLIASDTTTIRVLGSDQHPFADAGVGRGLTRLGAGCVVDVPAGSIDAVHWRAEFIAEVSGYTNEINPGFGAWIAAARDSLSAAAAPLSQDALEALTAPVDADGVLFSSFSDHLLLHNTRGEPRTVSLAGVTVDLEPLSLRVVAVPGALEKHIRSPS